MDAVRNFNGIKSRTHFVVHHFCEREYMLHGVKKTKPQFAYFHLKTACVCKKFPEFTKAQLTVAEETKVIVPEEVKNKLKDMGVKI